MLWEHLVLDKLITAGLPKIHFWRDKQQREVDFVVLRNLSDYPVEYRRECAVISPAQFMETWRNGNQ